MITEQDYFIQILERLDRLEKIVASIPKPKIECTKRDGGYPYKCAHHPVERCRWSSYLCPDHAHQAGEPHDYIYLARDYKP